MELRLKTLNQVIPNGITGYGIFKYLENYLPDLIFDLSELDIMFFSEYGFKIISQFTNVFVDEITGIILDSDMERLSKIIYTRYKTQWSHWYNLLLIDYDPITNYNMTEKENTITDDSEITNASSQLDGEDNTTNNNTITGTVTDSGTTITDSHNDESVNRDYHEDNENYELKKVQINGFNHGEVDSDSHEINDTLDKTGNENTLTNSDKDETVTNNNTTTNSHTDILTGKTTTNHTNTNNISTNGDSEINRELTREGNIGVTTTQQMMASEIDLWKWDFIGELFKQVSDMLTLLIY